MIPVFWFSGSICVIHFWSSIYWLFLGSILLTLFYFNPSINGKWYQNPKIWFNLYHNVHDLCLSVNKFTHTLCDALDTWMGQDFYKADTCARTDRHPHTSKGTKTQVYHTRSTSVPLTPEHQVCKYWFVIDYLKFSISLIHWICQNIWSAANVLIVPI